MRRRGPFDPRSVGNLVLWLDGAEGGIEGLWPDKSGNGRPASQSATNNRPAIGTLGGRPAFSFDGLNDTLALPTLPITQWHAFAACSPTGSGTKTVLYVVNSSAQSFTLSCGAAGVVAASGSPSSSPVSSGADTRIGASWDSGTLKSYYKGLVGEVLIYSAPLSAGAVTGITQYLAAKWGV